MRTRRMPLTLLLLGLAACSAPCTPELVPADALPYQDCSADSDCVLTELNCGDSNSCGGQNLAVASSKLQEFEAFRGCWPTESGQLLGSSVLCAFACTAPVCSRGTCAIASNNCVQNDTGGFGGTTGGFGSTTGTTTGGFGATSTGSSSGSASGSTGSSSGSTSGSTGSARDGG